MKHCVVNNALIGDNLTNMTLELEFSMRFRRTLKVLFQKVPPENTIAILYVVRVKVLLPNSAAENDTTRYSVLLNSY